MGFTLDSEKGVEIFGWWCVWCVYSAGAVQCTVALLYIYIYIYIDIYISVTVIRGGPLWAAGSEEANWDNSS